MKFGSILKFIFVLFLAAVFTNTVVAKEENRGPDQVPAAKVMSENESIPFMKPQSEAEENAPTSGGLFLKTLGSMMLIIGLVFFGAWGLKKLGFGGNNFGNSVDSPDLAILSSVSPGSGQKISVVQYGDRTLLIGSTAQAFTLLADETGSEFPTDTPPTPRSVADLLAEEEPSFEDELALANERLTNENKFGGHSL